MNEQHIASNEVAAIVRPPASQSQDYVSEPECIPADDVNYDAAIAPNQTLPSRDPIYLFVTILHAAHERQASIGW